MYCPHILEIIIINFNFSKFENRLEVFGWFTLCGQEVFFFVYFNSEELILGYNWIFVIFQGDN